MQLCLPALLPHVKNVRCLYPWFEGGQSQPDPDRSLVGVHHRVVVDVAVVAHSDRLVVVLVDAVERVDWFCGSRRRRRGQM